MTILILGTGALASLIGARLANCSQGADRVVLAGTWPEALAAIRLDGLRVEEADSAHAEAGSDLAWCVPVETLDLADPADLARARALEAELVIVLVKSHQTASIADLAVQAVAPGGLILTLQNGLGNREILEEATRRRHAPSAGEAAHSASSLAAASQVDVQTGLPASEDRARLHSESTASTGQVVVGVTTTGATSLAPGVARAGGRGRTMLGIGGAGAATRDLLLHLKDRFSTAGLPTELAEDIDQLVWRKLVASCAINPLSALYRLPNGRLLERPEPRATLETLAREVGAVASAIGIDLGIGPGGDAADLAVEVAQASAANRSSMLQDVERGRPTELDAINGAVVRLAHAAGVAVPANEAVIRRMEEMRWRS